MSLRRFIRDQLRAQPRIQFTEAEALLVAAAIAQFRPCRLLIFGAGNDSSMWQQLNAGGTTVFLEHNPEWIHKVHASDASLDIRLVEYYTRITQWQQLLETPDVLQMNLSADIRNSKWDVILVDAPNGFAMVDSFPRFGPLHGRMQSIYTAAQLRSGDGYVFVHDAEREVEAAYCNSCFSTSCRALFHFRQRKNNARLTELRCYFGGARTSPLPWRSRCLQLLAIWLRIWRTPDRQKRWKGTVTAAQ